MPWTRREIIQLGLLLLCVPLQYYLTSHDSESIEKGRTDIVLNLIKEIRSFKDTVLNISLGPWKLQWLRFLSWFVVNVLGIEENEVEESPAFEVMEYRKKLGLHRKSTKIRLERPKEVRYRVGQVVEHITEGYKGVIIEWYLDYETTKTPLYSLLLDEQNTVLVPTVKEVTQDKIYLLEKTKIVNSHLKNYFVSYDGAQYIPQPWLREMYPND